MSLSTSAYGRPSGQEAERLVGVGRAHGKAVLLGEHAVVYGAPALAVPVPGLVTTATAARFPPEPSGVDDMTFTMAGLTPKPVVLRAADGLRRLVAEFRERTGVGGEWRIDVLIDCLIPTGRGLGSSAACARAVVLALAELFDRELDPAAVFDLVQTAERVAHGSPSGIDALATGSPVPILFAAGRADEARIAIDGQLVIADSGVAGSTKDAVALLRRRFDRAPGERVEFTRRVSLLVHDAVRALAGGDAHAFGARMTDNHRLLAGIGVSTDLIDALVDAALDAGSLGAKISGGGLGGCMIALAEDPLRAQVILRRLHEAGAVRTWIVPLGEVAGDAR